jgi:hypothetical protein
VGKASLHCRNQRSASFCRFSNVSRRLFTLSRRFDVLWEAWTLRSKEEAKHVFGPTFNALTRKNFSKTPLCDKIFMTNMGGRLFFFNGEFYFFVKKVFFGPDGNYFYTIVWKSLNVSSNDFSNDIGRIRYGIKRKGTRSHSRPPP